MKKLLVLIMLLSLSLLAPGCSKTEDEGKVVSAEQQKQVEASIPQNIQNAHIPPQAKAQAMRGQEMGRKMGQAMNQHNTGQ
jgi:hypothetical protein